MKSDATRKSGASRRRHGRVRRWLVRPFFWGLAVLALVFFATVVYLDSDAFERRGSQWALEWLEARLQREVRAQDIRLELFPLTVDVRDLEIAGETPGAAPFARADRVVIEATIGTLLRPGITLDHVFLEAPEITVGYDALGRHDAPKWHRRRIRTSPRPLFKVAVGQMEIVQGALTLGHDRYPLDLSARNIRAGLAGGVDLELRGRATASDVEVQLPEARPYFGSVDLDALFRLGRVDIREARFNGPDLAATLSGIWRWRDTKDVDLRVIADSRLEVLDRLGYLEDFGAGPVHFEGSLRRKPGEWFLDGRFSSPGATILGRRLSPLSGRAVGDQEALRLDIESSRYGAGSVSGYVLISLAADGLKPVTVDLELSNVGLVQLLRDQSIPVQNLAATVSGPFRYEFPRASPRRGDGSGDLVVSPAGVDGDRDLAVWGAVPLVISDGVISSESIRLNSEAQVFLAEGQYDLDSSAGEFGFSITTKKVQELLPLMSNLTGESQLWQPSAGVGLLSGTLSLSGGIVKSGVQFELEAVEAPGFSARRLAGDCGVEEGGVEDLRLELSRPSAAMIVTGSVPFEDETAPVSPVRLVIESAGWPLEDVIAWSPWSLTLAGDFTGSLELQGDLEKPAGMLQGRLESATWNAIDAQALDVDLEFDPERLHVKKARVEMESGFLAAEGGIELGDGTIHLDLSSKLDDLGELPVVSDLAGKLTGEIDMSARVEGSLSSPVLSGVVECQDLVVGQGLEEGSGTTRIEVEWADGQVRLGGSFGQLVELDGGGRLDGDAAEIDLAVKSERLGEILNLAVGSAAAGLDGSGRGTVRLQVPWENPAGLRVLLRLDDLVVVRGDQMLENLEPVILAADTDGLSVKSLYLGEGGGDSEAFFAGRIGTGSTARVDLNVQASLASEWFQPWLPGVEIKGGDFEVIGKISGSTERLEMNGQGELRGARALIDGFPSSMEGIQGMVLFYPNRIVLDDAIAEIAGGRLRAGGSIDIEPDGEMPYRFQISGDGLSFRYPEGWLIHGDTELTLASTSSGRQISGVARLDSALYVEDVQLIKSLFERRRVEAGDLEPWRSETQLNLAVEIANGLRIQNNLADITGGAEFGVRGSLARPVLFGTVELDEGGRLIYSGQEYTVERGLLNFTNPFRIEPVLDLVASTRMREFDVTLSLSGTPDRLQTEFVSNPPLAELEVLALLTGGRDPGSRSVDQPETDVDSGAAESFLYGQATSLIAGRFNRLFGLDQFRIDPLTSSTGDLSSARVTVGKQLSRDLFVTYSYDPSQTEEQILELEWSLSRSLLLVLTQNGDGTYAVDARWEKAL